MANVCEEHGPSWVLSKCSYYCWCLIITVCNSFIFNLKDITEMKSSLSGVFDFRELGFNCSLLIVTMLCCFKVC